MITTRKRTAGGVTFQDWLVDARGERFDFQILKRGTKGYVESRKVGGWAKTAAFDAQFRLARAKDRSGNPIFTLSVK